MFFTCNAPLDYPCKRQLEKEKAKMRPASLSPRQSARASLAETNACKIGAPIFCRSRRAERQLSTKEPYRQGSLDPR